MSVCTLDEFRGFFLAKAFDVVGNGSYRKHLARCKEAGDPWAIAMGAQLQATQSHIREVHAAVTGMPPTANNLNDICRDVMMSAQPPIRLNAGCVACSITGQRTLRCLDLSRAHKGNEHLYVDPRFCFFFMLLWYCNKLEYVIRCYTRTWLDGREDGESFKAMCCALRDDLEPCIVRMHSLFVVAKSHVLATIERHVESNRYEPVLSLPAVGADSRQASPFKKTRD